MEIELNRSASVDLKSWVNAMIIFSVFSFFSAAFYAIAFWDRGLSWSLSSIFIAIRCVVVLCHFLLRSLLISLHPRSLRWGRSVHI